MSVGLLLYGTAQYGLGVSRDSVIYLDASRNLVENAAFATNYNTDTLEPVTHWPVLYPAALIPFHIGGGEPAQTGRLINAFLLAAFIVAVELLVLRATQLSRYYATVAGLFVALAYPTLYVFSRIWSETLFLPLVFSGMVLLAWYLLRPSYTSLVLSSILFALAWLSRYVGVAILATGCLAILFWSRQKWSFRVRDSLIMGLIGAVPMAVLMLRNYVLTNNAADRHISFHPVDRFWWQQALNTVSAWVAPASFDSEYKVALALCVLAAVGFSAIVVYTDSKAEHANSGTTRDWTIASTQLLLILVYTATFVAVVTVLDSGSMGYRTAMTLLPAATIAVAYSLKSTLDRVKRYHTVAYRILIVVVVLGSIALVSFQFMRSTKWAIAANAGGLGYRQQEYLHSPVTSRLAELSADTRVYSNNAELAHFLTDRCVIEFLRRECDPTCSNSKQLYDEVVDESDGSIVFVWSLCFDLYDCLDCFEYLMQTNGFTLTAADGQLLLYERP